MGCESSMEVKARADGGDREAQYRYAWHHTIQTYEVIKYLKMAGEQDHIKAALCLGYLYHEGVMNINYRQYRAYKNDVEANKWYIIAGNLRGIESTQSAVDVRNRLVAEQEQKRRDHRNRLIAEKEQKHRDRKEQLERQLRDCIERDEQILRDHKERVERELKDGSKKSLFTIGIAHIIGTRLAPAKSRCIK